jgi:glucose-1-phosphate adenylyltransferase
MLGADWFQGTADAVHQNIGLIEQHAPNLVAVFGADHIYRMDIQQMVKYHHRQEADVTISALPVPIEQAKSLGVMVTNAHGRVIEFQEKPSNPTPMPGRPNMVLASMGNYIFNTPTLLEGLNAAKQRGESDFGQHVLPSLMQSHNLYAYDFSTNRVPGVKSHEQQVYWRDVGTIDAYFEAHKDVLGLEPKFDAFNPQWPIYSSNYQGPVARVIGGEINDTLLGAATVINAGSRISNSIIRREAIIEEDVELTDCIIMDYVRIGKGSRLRRTIVDRHNNIAPGTQIGFDAAEDQRRFTVSPGGVAVVPIGKTRYYARGSRGGAGPGYAE